ncbi:MAG TPA: GNAT family N-acetyltransferase [Steroidobacteraceae bacterium]|nr:GNAT family N-acetyltransferase [Steroidobacteraceae bacterium]
MLIRDAPEGDLPGLLDIYNEVIATSTAIYSSVPATLQDRRDWWCKRLASGYPVLSAVDRSGVLGFASFGEFRAGPGYRFTVEHSVHVRAGCRGRGIGQALMAALFTRAQTLGKHVMVAGVDGSNSSSIRFHERLGFERVGHLRETGCKFGRWLDLVLLQRLITDP